MKVRSKLKRARVRQRLENFELAQLAIDRSVEVNETWVAKEAASLPQYVVS